MPNEPPPPSVKVSFVGSTLDLPGVDGKQKLRHIFLDWLSEMGHAQFAEYVELELGEKLDVTVSYPLNVVEINLRSKTRQEIDEMLAAE